MSPSTNAYDHEHHHRRSIRLKGYDYALAGAYFVTICTQNRICLFGDIVASLINLNDAGQMVKAVWDAIPDNYPCVDLDQFVIMPNHIHGIILLAPATNINRHTIVGAGPRACPVPGSHGQPGDPGQPRGVAPTSHGQPRDLWQPGEPGQPGGVAPTPLVEPRVMSLGDVVHRFKTLTTKTYTDGVKQYGWPAYPARLWQRNYYEHIIRDEASLNRIRHYIAGNPATWADDGENPERQEKNR